MPRTVTSLVSGSAIAVERLGGGGGTEPLPGLGGLTTRDAPLPWLEDPDVFVGSDGGGGVELLLVGVLDAGSLGLSLLATERVSTGTLGGTGKGGGRGGAEAGGPASGASPDTG
jgi:hypothetical protein